MSQGYAAGGADPYVADSGQESSTVDTAKHEAGEVKDAATGAVKDVAATAKQEAGGVARETKHQARALLDQGRQELRDQASKQQQRLASGLTSVGDQLGSMAAGSQTSGVAADLVQQASDRVGAVGSWFAERDPAMVLTEVKAFARRRPGVFITAGVVAGIVVGRLARALTSNAGQASGNGSGSGSMGTARPALPASTGYDAAAGLSVSGGNGSTGSTGMTGTTGMTGAGTAPMGDGLTDTPTGDAAMDATGADAPIYSQSAARFDGTGMEGTDERSDSL